MFSSHFGLPWTTRLLGYPRRAEPHLSGGIVKALQLAQLVQASQSQQWMVAMVSPPPKKLEPLGFIWLYDALYIICHSMCAYQVWLDVYLRYSLTSSAKGGTTPIVCHGHAAQWFTMIFHDYHDLPFAVEVFHSTFLDYRYHFPKAFHWGQNPKWHLHGRESTEEHPKNQPHRIDGSLESLAPKLPQSCHFSRVETCAETCHTFSTQQSRSSRERWGWHESPNPGAQFMDTIHLVVSMIFNHGLFMITSYIIWSIIICFCCCSF